MIFVDFLHNETSTKTSDASHSTPSRLSVIGCNIVTNYSITTRLVEIKIANYFLIATDLMSSR